MKKCSMIVAVFAALGFLANSFVYADESDLKILTRGVDSIAQTGAPGPVVSFGENAFPVVIGRYDNQTSASLVAASRVGKGRIVAFGHPDYIKVRAITLSPGTERFMSNAIEWAANGERESADVLVWRDESLAKYLIDQGVHARVVTELPEEFDLLVGDAFAFTDAQYDKLFESVNNGAGFITGGLGWGWSQLNPGKSLLNDFRANRVFRKYGVNLAWTQGFVDPTLEKGYKVDAQEVLAKKYVSGAATLEFLRQITDTNAAVDELVAKLDPNDARQIAATQALAYPNLDAEVRAPIDQFALANAQQLVPTEKNPIRGDDLLARLLVSIQTERYLRGQTTGETDANEAPALKAAEDFPGAPDKSAPRLNNVLVKIKSATPDWNSTGLYAAPGETITVTIANDILAKLPKPLGVRIGAHRDTLWHLGKWTRYPEICLEKKLSTSVTTISNPFGGPVYITVPRGLGSVGLGQIDVTISGAVAAPYFIKDVTSLEEWKTNREAPGPWAELQGRNIILTVPSRVVRNLDNPQRLMEVWDRVLDLEAELNSGPYVRERPERICCDRQISAGYMHSGYPVMTWMDVEKAIVDAEKLASEGNWGFYHEFGHNHQSPNWTFQGTTEVTCNYFSLYVMEKLNGKRAEEARGELTKEQRLKDLKKYLDDGANFETWKAKPFLALNMTVQIRNEFGWEPIWRAINEYTKASADELPKSDLEKRDQWMVRLSRNCGRNLAPFFEKWGVPTSQEARDSLADLPTWISDEFNEID